MRTELRQHQMKAVLDAYGTRTRPREVSSTNSAIAELDQLLDEVLAQLGIPDDDVASSKTRQPKVDEHVVKLLQRADDVVDALQKQLGIPDDDDKQ